MNPIFDVISGGISGILKPILDKAFPDANERLQAEAAVNAQVAGLVSGQLEINKIEAASPSMFVAGWRPAVGWTCVSGLGYQVILRPVIQSTIMFWYPQYAMVQLEIETLMTLLFGMLGLGAYRTYEKTIGVK